MFCHIMPLIVAAAWDKNLFRLTHTAISSLEVIEWQYLWLHWGSYSMPQCHCWEAQEVFENVIKNEMGW